MQGEKREIMVRPDKTDVSPFTLHQAQGVRRSALVLTVGGFTIIEVMIVLAIAALILVVVFLAVPALQRSQRNSARRSDAGRIAAAIVDWSSSHSNSLPSECVNFPAALGSLAQFSGLTCSAAAAAVVAPAVNTLTIATSPASFPVTLTIPPNAGNIVEIVEKGVCDTSVVTNNQAKAGVSSNNSAVLYSFESGNTWAWNCVSAI